GPPTRRIDLGGQKIAFATSTRPGDTSLDTHQMTLGWALPRPDVNRNALEANQQAACYPTGEGADGPIPAVRPLVGGGEATIGYFQSYLENVWDPQANKAEVFARLAQTAASTIPAKFGFPTAAIALTFRSDKSGGLVT